MILRPPILTVDRREFEVTLWKPALRSYVPKRRYPVAIGALGHETPAGMYFVERKSLTPEWLAPDAEWVAEEDRGKIFPFDDPKNPFAGAFISISLEEGVGFHGTKFAPHLGEAVSHGCVRMATRHVLDLYDRVPLGTPVFVY